MFGSWRMKRPSHATVVSYLALFVALGGTTAYAANTIGSDDIIDESIQSVDLKNGEVKTSDMANSSVTSLKIHNGSVLTDEIGANAVDGSKILDGAVGNADLATGAVDSASVLNESLTNADLGTDSVQATEVADNSLDSGEIVDNSLGSADIGPDAIGSSELANNAVGSANISNEAVTLSDIAGVAVNGSISLSGISNGRCDQVTFNIGGAQVGDSAIVGTRAAIQNGIVLIADRVSSAGHLIVSACNFSGAAMTPISDFPVRIITFR
jgi:hypothetical protein